VYTRQHSSVSHPNRIDFRGHASANHVNKQIAETSTIIVGGSWNSDGTILFGSVAPVGIYGVFPLPAVRRAAQHNTVNLTLA
jgi:hypothetical protein